MNGVLTAVEKVDRKLVEIQNNESVEELKKILQDLANVEYLLKQADEFREQSIKFAKLEAYTLIRIVQLGGLKELRGNRRSAAEWLSTLSEEEVEKYISMCGDGLTIDQVWSRERGKPGNLKYYSDKVQSIKQQIFLEAEHEGSVKISDYEKEIVKYGGEFTADIKDGIRVELRRKGFVGLDNKDGEYINPCDKRNESKIPEAVKVRFVSIKKDMLKLLEIMKYGGKFVSLESFLGDNIREAFGNPNGSLFQLMFMGEVGILDKKELYRFLYEAPINAEENDGFRKYVDEMRKLYIKKAYEKFVMEVGNVSDE